MLKSAFGLPVWLAVSFAAGWFGSRYMPGTWYAALVKPAWAPPSVIFAPVWSILYALMGIAAWLVWRRVGFSGAPLALGFFLFQLLLNGLWPFLFFGLHRPGAAFFEILVLWAFILSTLLAFWRIQHAAGALMLPYLCWVGFASLLNFYLWHLNV